MDIATDLPASELMYGRRKVGIREPKRTFLIVCEGRTEKNYFEAWKRLNGIPGLIRTGQNCTDPEGLLNKTLSEMQEVDYSEVWCVFDRDNNLEEMLNKVSKHAVEKGVNTCFSNPCFELWFLLHHEKPKKPFENKEEILERLSKLRGRRFDASSDFVSFAPRVKDAIKKAEDLQKDHEKKCIAIVSRHSNPSTQVFSLVKKLKEIRT